MKDRSYGTDNFIATVLCILQHPSLSFWSRHSERHEMGYATIRRSSNLGIQATQQKILSTITRDGKPRILTNAMLTGHR